MQIDESPIPGVFVVTPERLPDERGVFFEGFHADRLADALGRPFVPRQVNYSVSRRHTLRGVHSVTVPPGQAKYVNCVRGAVRDITVDLRLGSPAFGRHQVTELDAESGRAVIVPEGVGHGFLTRTEDATVCYLLSSTYVPGTQIDIDPFDPELALPWECPEPPLISKKDATAPRLAEVRAAGLLVSWSERQ